MYRLVAMFMVACVAVGCASGSVVLTGMKRPPVSSTEVKLYTKAPADYEVIGIVKASSDAGMTEQGSMDYAIEELKKQAASVGANGVLLKTVGKTGGDESISGEAIYVGGKQ
jgi:hypothetical protein